MANETTLREMEAILVRLKTGDAAAHGDLIQVASRRLEALCSKQLNKYYRLRGHGEQTGDIFSIASMRLQKSLQEVKPGTALEFFGLASEQIRRCLLDLIRHHYGREGNREVVNFTAAPGESAPGLDPADVRTEQQRLETWVGFHEQVKQLPQDEREVIDLLYYQNMTQEDAAQILSCDPSTVKRRHGRALRKLAKLLKDWKPDE